MQPLIRTSDVWKFFGPNAALAGADFAVYPGEVHVLAGANGAGKSTLVKILYGAEQADSGTLYWKEQLLDHFGIARALELGIAYIPQEVQVVPQLSVAENILLGNRPLTATRQRASTAAAAVGLAADPSQPAGRLSVAERQLVAIARGLARRAELLLLDEPTAALSPAEIQRLFDIVARLKAEGSGIIFISHRMEEIERIGDRITVLRDGRIVFSGALKEVTADRIVSLMTGREVTAAARPIAGAPRAQGAPVLLRVERLMIPDRVAEVSIELRAGEVLGVAGVVGSGRTSLVRALFGAEPDAEGAIFIDGRGPLPLPRSPAEAIAAGIALLTEDRKDQGLVPTADVATNMSLAAGARFVRGIYFDHSRERAMAEDFARRLAIRTPSVAFPARLLSGGNQQKTLLARWLATGARVFLLDEPTRGIDVEAKRFVYGLVREIAAEGKGVLFISSELPEVLEVADRILILHRGHVHGEVLRGQTDEHGLLMAAMGTSRPDWTGAEKMP